VSELKPLPRTLAEADLARRFGLTIGLKLVVVGVLDFVLLRILAPNLVNRHQDLALAGAVLCLVIALVATIWLGFQLWRDLKQLADARRQLRRGPSLKVIPK
jgi:hypothetical protein